MAQDELDPYLTAPEIARLLRVSVRTFWRWEKSGLGPIRTSIGRKALFRYSAVEEWLKSREQGPAPVPAAKPSASRPKAPIATGRSRRKNVRGKS